MNDIRVEPEFVTEDLLSDVKDKLHPKPYTEGKDLERWSVRRVKFLEWGTERAPGKFRRKSFPEMHEAKEKLLSLRISGDKVLAAYDSKQLYSNHTLVTFVPWHSLKGVRNRSIRKTAKYKNEIKRNQTRPAVFREDLEELSRRFAPKFLLAVMNSTFSKSWLAIPRVRSSSRPNRSFAGVLPKLLLPTVSK